jgi:hypothetical protein
LEHGHNYDRRRRSRSLCHVYSDVGYCAQRTVRVSVGVRMGVRDLHGTGKDHEHDAQNREEKPPRMPCPLLPVAATHTSR